MAPLYAAGTAPKCGTRYPIVLVHGGGFSSNNLLGINYWNDIPKALEDEGADVYITIHDSFNGHAEMAAQVAVQLAELFAVHPTWTKVNLIAHSQGPLGCRYLISNCTIPGKGPASKYVASLTSIGGVHRGSPLADLIWGLYNGVPAPIGDTIANAVNAFARFFFFDENNPDCLKNLYNVTIEFMTKIFNPMTPDAPGVYYQSWGGRITRAGLDLKDIIITPLWLAMNMLGAGDNDGLVPVSSAKWGRWRGIIPSAEWANGVDHLDEVDQLFGMTPGFDAPAFYVDVVSELKAMGY